jgi:hypothetical protein
MECFVCGKSCGYPVCNDCTRKGFDVNKIISGEQVVPIKKSKQETLL